MMPNSSPFKFGLNRMRLAKLKREAKLRVKNQYSKFFDFKPHSEIYSELKVDNLFVTSPAWVEMLFFPRLTYVVGCDDTESFDYRSKKIAEARRMKGLIALVLVFLTN
jgi:hypothetical protein